MNIFVTDTCPAICAQNLCDKHVVKMILESCQLLCGVYHTNSTLTDIPYKLTHKNHPCSIWSRESSGNFNFLLIHTFHLLNEYTLRYNKIHKCQDVHLWCKLNKNSINFNSTYQTPFPKCMPDEFKILDDNPINCYRYYYANAKESISQWNKLPTRKPEWLNQYKLNKTNELQSNSL